MQIQHFPQTRIYTWRASFNAMRQVMKFGFPYKLEIIGLAYESAPNAELDEEWYKKATIRTSSIPIDL